MNQAERPPGQDNQYDVNFFRPSTPFLKDNVRAISIGLFIWFIAVFGFQILLKSLEHPTPEPAYIRFQEIYPKFETESVPLSEKKELASIYLSLIAKSTSKKDREVIQKAFTVLLFDILPESEKGLLSAYQQMQNAEKSKMVKYFARVIWGEKKQELIQVIPYALVQLPLSQNVSLDRQLVEIMNRYLVHNRSVLTDSTFLGFPFHYFYTGVALLLLFILICLTYCKVIDRILKKHGIESPYE